MSRIWAFLLEKGLSFLKSGMGARLLLKAIKYLFDRITYGGAFDENKDQVRKNAK